jgi:hypothetical protein
MSNFLVDQKVLIGKEIDALALSERERSRAHAALAHADVLTGVYFAIAKLLKPRQRRAIARPSRTHQM